MATHYFHGGVSGLQIGGLLVPSPPKIVDDGCPICVARREGRTLTVGQWKRHLELQGDAAKPLLKMLEGANDDDPIDPPSAKSAVYVTTDCGYARWYAARSKGDLYRVEPIGELEPTTEDHFPSFTVATARVVEVIERRVRLDRRDRRLLMRQWAKADRKEITA